MWGKILKTIPAFNGFPARCTTHGTCTLITDAGAFAALAPFGGCVAPCNAVLACGHRCSMVCHPPTTPHLPCRALVTERCRAGHSVQRLCSSSERPPCSALVVEKCAGYMGERHELVRICSNGTVPACTRCEALEQMDVRRQKLEAERVRHDATPLENYDRCNEALDQCFCIQN